MKKMRQTLLGTLLATLLACPLANAAAIDAPYTEDFNDGIAQNFSYGSPSLGTGGYSTWTLTGTQLQHELYVTPSSYGTSIAYATVQVNNLGGATNQDFTLASDFTPTAATGNSSRTQRFGMAALSNGTVVSEYTSTTFYFAQVLFSAGNGTSGTMVIASHLTSGTGSTIISGNFGDMSLDTTYHMSFVGDYTGSGLVLSFTLSDGVNSTTISTDPIASPLSGHYFGYRNRVQAGGQTVLMDNFQILDSLPIPEPASVALFACAGVFALFGRRKK